MNTVTILSVIGGLALIAILFVGWNFLLSYKWIRIVVAFAIAVYLVFQFVITK